MLKIGRQAELGPYPDSSVLSSSSSSLGCPSLSSFPKLHARRSSAHLPLSTHSAPLASTSENNQIDMFSSAVVLLAAVAPAFATVFVRLTLVLTCLERMSSSFAPQVTSPVASSNWAANQQQTISWKDDGQTPSLQEFGVSKVSVYVGNQQQQVSLPLFTPQCRGRCGRGWMGADVVRKNDQ